MKKKMLIILGIIVLILFIIRLYIDHEVLETSFYEMKSTKIPNSFDGYKIVQISDLHSKSFGKESVKLINQIDILSPDIVVLTGDMVSANEKEYDDFFYFAKQIAQKYDTYYIFGNHEESLETKYKNAIKKFVKDNGIIFLENDKVVLEKNGEKINLYGFMPEFDYYSKRKKAVLESRGSNS